MFEAENSTEYCSIADAAVVLPNQRIASLPFLDGWKEDGDDQELLTASFRLFITSSIIFDDDSLCCYHWGQIDFIHWCVAKVFLPSYFKEDITDRYRCWKEEICCYWLIFSRPSFPLLLDCFLGRRRSQNANLSSAGTAASDGYFSIIYPLFFYAERTKALRKLCLVFLFLPITRAKIIGMSKLKSPSVFKITKEQKRKLDETTPIPSGMILFQRSWSFKTAATNPATTNSPLVNHQFFSAAPAYVVSPQLLKVSWSWLFGNKWAPDDFVFWAVAHV